MKKVLIVLASLLGLILIAAIILPIIFKDDIQAAIDKQLDKALNARVYYDADAFSVSLIRNFPNVSVTVDDFGVVGNAPFEGDTLADVSSFGLTLDIFSVIGGDQIEIVSVNLDEPTIHVIVLEDGSANYDIAKETGDTTTTESSGEPVNIQINNWEINNANVIYEDRSSPMLVSIGSFNHSGSGDFSQEVFDMNTTSEIEALSFNYDGVEYLTDKHLMADIIMEMDLANMKFTFKENRLDLNNFGFGFDGFLHMQEDAMEMDITFAGKEIDLASIISLIPGVYQDYLAGLTASGEINFQGYVRGTMDDNTMPSASANFRVRDGKVLYSEYPVPMEDIQINADFKYPSGDLTETSFNMDKFHLSLDGEEVTASLFFKNLEDYYWDLKVNGNADLDKINQVIPLEADMELSGLISANLETKGRMSDLEAERYNELPTSGNLNITGFKYVSSDLPQGFGISETKMTLDPSKIALSTFKGNAGNSDLNMSGQVSNYLSYALDEEATLYGELDFQSSLVDLNEWMTEADEEEVEEDTSAIETVRIPENIDFVLTSTIDEIVYDNLNLKDFSGKVIARDGALILEKSGFNLLDGRFEMEGSYESATALEMPLYDFEFIISDLSIPAAFNSFTSIQNWVPVAEKMTGKFSTDFEIGGAIGEGMQPIYDKMHGAGIIEIAEASLTNLDILKQVSSVTKLKQGDGEMDIKDIIVGAEIKGGRLYVDPFDVSLAGRTATISGSTGIDGTIDYTMATQVPSGQVGQAVNNAIASVAGVDDLIGQNITINLGIAGTYDDPKVKLLGAEKGTSVKASATAAVKAKAKEEFEEKKAEIKEEVEQVKEEAIAEAEKEVEKKKEEVKKEVEEEVEEQKEELKDKAEDALKGIFGKKKKSGGN